VPNYCQNFATLSHPDTAQIQRVMLAAEHYELFSAFVPVPEELTKPIADTVTDEDVELSRQRIELYGYDNAYDWCVGNWGTKWDADAEVLMSTPTSVDLDFDTAWSPPTAWYQHMTALGFTVDAYYYEASMGFCGHWSDGQDNYYEVGVTSAETEANIPSDINDTFSISEMQWEWEQENREELQAWIEDAVAAKKEESQQ
jgi:hypothetical protein